MAELIKKYEQDIEAIALIPSDGGRFEVTVNGELIYSKLKTYRHAEKGEIAALVEQLLEEER